MDGDLTDILQKQINMIEDLQGQSLALQGLCASLMVEVAILNNSPPNKLKAMVTYSKRAAQSVAEQIGSDASRYQRTVERVCAIAEAALADPHT